MAEQNGSVGETPRQDLLLIPKPNKLRIRSLSRAHKRSAVENQSQISDLQSIKSGSRNNSHGYGLKLSNQDFDPERLLISQVLSWKKNEANSKVPRNLPNKGIRTSKWQSGTKREVYRKTA